MDRSLHTIPIWANKLDSSQPVLTFQMPADILDIGVYEPAAYITTMHRFTSLVVDGRYLTLEENRLLQSSDDLGALISILEKLHKGLNIILGKRLPEVTRPEGWAFSFEITGDALSELRDDLVDAEVNTTEREGKQFTEYRFAGLLFTDLKVRSINALEAAIDALR